MNSDDLERLRIELLANNEMMKELIEDMQRNIVRVRDMSDKLNYLAEGINNDQNNRQAD